jgi:alpha-ketoglutarate-dependent taurine dioxygenase
MPSLDLRKITGRIGAQVSDLDINGDLDAGIVTAIRDALNEHKVLVFDGVHLDDEGQERFAGYFGPLTSAHPTVPSVEGAPNVLPVDSEEGRANHCHTDVTFVVNPPQASTLRSIVLPPYGGETLIANSGAAYRGLPDRCEHWPRRYSRSIRTTTTTRSLRRPSIRTSASGARCSARSATRPRIPWCAPTR